MGRERGRIENSFLMKLAKFFAPLSSYFLVVAVFSCTILQENKGKTHPGPRDTGGGSGINF